MYSVDIKLLCVGVCTTLNWACLRQRSSSDIFLLLLCWLLYRFGHAFDLDFGQGVSKTITSCISATNVYLPHSITDMPTHIYKQSVPRLLRVPFFLLRLFLLFQELPHLTHIISWEPFLGTIFVATLLPFWWPFLGPFFGV